MTENKEQKREDMIGGDEIAVVPANEEIADTLLPKKEEEDELIVKFRKPYKFEDDTFTELDLHGLEDLTGRPSKRLSTRPVYLASYLKAQPHTRRSSLPK